MPRRVGVVILLLCGVTMIASCGDLLEDEGGASNSGKGSIYELLSERGNYTYFLKAADMTNYAKLLQGTGLVTVFAPDDTAFADYLNATFGTTEMDGEMVDQLREVVGYHIIQFSYTPTDLEAFSTNSATDTSARGDGLSYKFKTFSKPANLNLKGADDRDYEIYSAERYIPVFSNNMFNSKSIATPSEDYLKLFPGAKWHSEGGDLYVGNAFVTESGIPTDNGYLYLIDQVAHPAKTIYETLKSDPEWKDDYSLYFELTKRVELFQYSKTHSDKYAQPGDSLFLFYHYNKPSTVIEIPEIASELCYHDEDGVNFERPMRNTVHCFVPNNSVLESYIRDNYSDYDTTLDNYIDNLPLNVVYHILQSHSIDKREITLPSEMASRGIVDSYGQTLNLQSADIDRVKYCSNGLLYGINKIVDTKMMNGIAGALLKNSEYEFFSTAFNQNNLYQIITASDDRYTLLVSNDDNLLTYGGYFVNEPTINNGVVSYVFKKSTATQNANVISTLMRSYLYKGVVDMESDDNLRYYLADDGVTYLYVYNKQMYDESGGLMVPISNTDYSNGSIIEIGTLQQVSTETVLTTLTLSNTIDESNYDANASTHIFNELLTKAAIADLSFFVPTHEYMCFVPSDQAMLDAFSAGRIPACIELITAAGVAPDPVSGLDLFTAPQISYKEDPLAPGFSDEDLAELTRFLTSHFVSRNENNYSCYLLPSLSPYGAGVEYSMTATTSAPYSATVAPTTINIEWNESEPNILSLRDGSAYTIKTTVDPMPQITKDGVVYIVDNCFSQDTNQ